jgi:hypothetical protein
MPATDITALACMSASPLRSDGPSSTTKAIDSGTRLRCHVAAMPVYVPPVIVFIGSFVSCA